MEEEETQTQPQPLVKSFMGPQNKSLSQVILPALVIFLIILAGGITGYFLANRGVGAGPSSVKKLTGGGELVESTNEAGIKDTSKFPDTTKGKLEVNDNPNIAEGSHRLVRPGGPSQTAYLTSSVVDLNKFVGRCVEIWGATFSAKKAGWFLDVGHVKVLDNCPEGV